MYSVIQDGKWTPVDKVDILEGQRYRLIDEQGGLRESYYAIPVEVENVEEAIAAT